MKRWFLKQAGCESLSLVARRPGSCLDPQPQSPQHTHVTSGLPCAAILGADLTFTLSPFTLNVLRSSSLTPLEERIIVLDIFVGGLQPWIKIIADTKAEPWPLY